MSQDKNKTAAIQSSLWKRWNRDKYSDILLVAVLILCGLYLYMWGIGSYSLWDPWEPKYGQAMREMADRKDFITPYYDDYIRWTKPILIYWAMYVPILIAGNNEFTVRLPSVIASMLGVLTVFFILKKLRNKRTAMIAACILGTMPQYFYMARQAMPDMLLTFFLCAAMGFFAIARFGRDHNKLYFILFYVSVSLAFLTKGPVACVIVFCAILLFWMISFDLKRLFSLKTIVSDLRNLFNDYHIVLGFLIFLVISSPWYVTMLIKHGHSFIDTFVKYENIARFKEPIRGHHGLFTYYIQTIFHGMYPWGCMLPAGIIFLFHGRMGSEEEKQRWYYLSWFISIFVIFSIAGTKQQHYFLPITPVAAILIALVWEQYFKEKVPFWIPIAFLISIAFFLLPIRDFLFEGNKYIFDNFTNKRTIDNIDVDNFLKSIFIAWSIIMVLSLFLRRSRMIAALAILVAYVNGAYFCHYVIPKHTKHRTVKHYVEYYQKNKASDSPLVFYGKMRPSMNYYGGKERYSYFPRGQEKKLAAFVKGENEVFIIAEHKRIRRLMRRLREQTKFDWYTVSREHSRYDLISNKPKSQSYPIRR